MKLLEKLAVLFLKKRKVSAVINVEVNEHGVVFPVTTKSYIAGCDIIGVKQ